MAIKFRYCLIFLLPLVQLPNVLLAPNELQHTGSLLFSFREGPQGLEPHALPGAAGPSGCNGREREREGEREIQDRSSAHKDRHNLSPWRICIFHDNKEYAALPVVLPQAQAQQLRNQILRSVTFNLWELT